MIRRHALPLVIVLAVLVSALVPLEARRGFEGTTPSRTGQRVPATLYDVEGVRVHLQEDRPTEAEIAQAQKEDLDHLKKRMPALENDRGDRWPVLVWGNHRKGGPYAEAMVEAFVERGIGPLFNASASIRQAQSMLPQLKAFRDRGYPLIMLPQGWVQRAFRFPPDGTACEHLPPAKRETENRDFTCPAWMMENPAVLTHAGNAFAVCQYLKQNGIEPEALFMDYETGVYLRNGAENAERLRPAMEEALKCPRCLERFGRDRMNTLEKYSALCEEVRAYTYRIGFVEPVKQVFPDCRTGNYYVYPIRRLPFPENEYPSYGWTGSGMDVAQPRCYFTPGWFGGGGDRAKMNWNIFYYCMDRFSSCARVLKDGEIMVPWVGYLWGHAAAKKKAARGNKIAEADAYREMAIHTLLRGAETIAVFAPGRITRELPEEYKKEDYPRRDLGQYILNVLDVQQGYDAILRFNDHLRKGKVLNLETPGERNVLDENTAYWSGVGTDERALIRTVTFHEPTVKTVEVFDRKVELPFRMKGQFFWVYPNGRVEEIEE